MPREENGRNIAFQVLAKKIPGFGIILVTISSTLIALSTVLAKYVYHVNPFTQLFVRGVIFYASCLSVAIYKREPIFPRTDKKTAFLLWANASLGALISLLMYASFKFIPVADSTAILFTNPAIVAVLSTLFFGEKCNIYTIIIVCLSVAGCALVSKPTGLFEGSWDFDTYIYTIYGVILALVSSICFSLYLLSLKTLSNFPWYTLNFDLGICLIVFTVFGMLWLSNLGIPDCGTDGLVVLASSFLCLSGVVLIVLASRVENPKNLSVVQTVQLLMVMIFQIVILGTTPNWNTYLGSFLIVFSVLLTWGSKWWEARKKNTMKTVTCLDTANESSV